VSALSGQTVGGRCWNEEGLDMVVLGAGRVGTALLLAAQDRGASCSIVSRTAGWDVLDGQAGEPVIVATRNDDLAGVVERVPAHRTSDLVFVQNGMLTPWLRSRGLDGCTRGLLFFAAASVGERAQPGPQPSPFSGPHAALVVGWLSAVEIPAVAVDPASFAAFAIEKLVWNCAFGVLCQAHACDVGEVCEHHEPELRTLVQELAAIARAAAHVDLPVDWLLPRLLAYSRTIPTYRASVKEWRWRDGWFVEEARRLGLSRPVHHQLLTQLGEATD
jgi:hypothetical protein